MCVVIYLYYYYHKILYNIYFTDFRCAICTRHRISLSYILSIKRTFTYYYCLCRSGRLTYYTRIPTTRSRTPVTGDDRDHTFDSVCSCTAAHLPRIITTTILSFIRHNICGTPTRVRSEIKYMRRLGKWKTKNTRSNNIVVCCCCCCSGEYVL